MKVETWKIAIFFQENNDFYKISVFEKASKKTWLWLGFGMPKRRKIEKKTCWKTYVCLPLFFLHVLVIFAMLARFWESLGPPKIKKNVLFTRSVLKEGSGRVLGGFWDGFGKNFWNFEWILGRSGGDLGKLYFLEYFSSYTFEEPSF